MGFQARPGKNFSSVSKHARIAVWPETVFVASLTNADYFEFMTRLLPHTILTLGLILAPQSALADEPAQNPPPAPSTDSPTAENPAPTSPGTDSAPAAPNDRPEQPLPDKPVENPAPPAEKTAEKGRPHLRIEADRPGVRLLRIDRVMSDDMGEGMLVKTICTAPCNQVIDGRRRQTFFFGADGMVPSRGFRLARLDGNIVARVQGGSIVARQVGYLFAGFGGAAVIGGATMLGVGYSQNGTHLSSEGKIVEGPNPAIRTGGFITLGIGTAMVTTAVILVLTAKTKISLIQADDQSARLSFENGVFRF
jgi:hypothetical protein